LSGPLCSEYRLDFTCIGFAVNLAARSEKLTGELGLTILASEELAKHVPSEFVPAGKFSLRGFRTSQAVFGLRDETSH
jgi:adenylate cyclase